MIFLELFTSFFTLGLFCFGGGYAAIGIIQDIVLTKGWMSVSEFANIIAVAESTPGPVAINTATYVGFKLEGLLGGAVGTFGLMAPAFILSMLVSGILQTPKGNAFFKRILFGIKPIVVGLIFVAAIIVVKDVLYTVNDVSVFSGINWLNVIIFIGAYFYMRKTKFSPLWLILLAAFLGVVLL